MLLLVLWGLLLAHELIMLLLVKLIRATTLEGGEGFSVRVCRLGTWLEYLEAIRCRHCNRLHGRLWRLLDLHSKAILLHKLDQRCMNRLSDFFLQAVKSDKVLYKHSQVITFSYNDISSTVWAYYNRQVADDPSFLLLFFLRHTPISVHLILILRSMVQTFLPL